MKIFFCIILIFMVIRFPMAQEREETDAKTTQQLENMVEKDDIEVEDDAGLQQWEYYRKHPLNLNEAGEDDLKSLGILTDLQMVNFIRYRKALGDLVNIYELQAIPTWNIQVIKKILPFVTVKDIQSVQKEVRRRFINGDHSILFRYGRVIEKSIGYNKPDSGSKNYYLGSPAKLLFRYKYNYKNLLQFGVLGEKDAGEQFFKGAQRQGFDFYSFHLFARNLGKIKALAFGDYTINLGQGLIQWQGLAFSKSSLVIATKRQGPILRPYNSAGEFNFHRGAAITIQQKQIALTLFASARKFSGNMAVDSSQSGETFISSLQTSGYHRTLAEINDRNSVKTFIAGGNIQYNLTNYHIGVNAIQYFFSKQLQKRNEPYNLFAFSGNRLSNYSVDYSYTFKNVHCFGEIATDNNKNIAFLNGLIASIDARVDMSLLYRNISKRYQSLFSNAFTENSVPSNEAGLYAGLSIRPLNSMQLDAYMDIYHFPWLKYRVDAPGSGKDYMVQLTYTPDNNTELYTRYKNDAKSINISGTDYPLNPVQIPPHRQWRIQMSQVLSRNLSLKGRMEVVWQNKISGQAEKGYLLFTDVFCKPFKLLSTNIRLQYFETDSYDSRVYAYEDDVLYSYSIPSFFDKGLRAYINVRKDIKNLFKGSGKQGYKGQIWLRIARNFFFTKKLIGSGLDTIEGESRTEVKLQMLFGF